MTHVVEAIAERVRELLMDATDAQDRISRDKSQADRFEAREDLPAVDVRVGEEEEFKPQTQSIWRATVRIHVDLYVADAAELVSGTLLELRAQAYKALMNAVTWPTGWMRILPAPAGEVLRNQSGSIPIAHMRTTFNVLYQHSLTDASQ